MAKKNKSTKKHRFKYTEPTSITTGAAAPVPASTATPRAASAAPVAVVAAGRDFSYVTTDLRRLSVLLVGLVVLEGVLWYLLNHTGLGNAVFNLIQV
jgi:hypothetical protein